MKEDALILDFMLARIGHIHEFTQRNRDLFFSSALVQSATLREMQLLTDATGRLSESARAALGDLNWREMKGFRNFLVHEYLGNLDLNVVWQVISEKLGNLEQSLKAYRKTLS